MSSIINNSNSNSALINTINASISKRNPDVYSTKRINPAYACVYQDTKKSSGAISASQTATFDLMKYGIAQQILLVYTKVAAGGASGSKAYDFMDVIDRVELLSSSKVIDTLTNKDLLAQFSDLESSQFAPISSGVINSRATDDGDTETYVLPLVFGFFKDVNTNLNLQFNEPMSIRVRFGAHPSNGIGAAGTTMTLTDCFLKMRYKAYNEADYSEVLTQNYAEPELSVMTTGFYDESVQQVTIAAGATDNGTTGTPIELKNTDCVNNFFITIREVGAAAATGATEKVPILPNRVVFTASGQTIFDLTSKELHYSRLCHNGFSVDASLEVAKIQNGLWEYSGSGTQSNTLSLRELNNPVITIFFSGVATKVYEVCVCEEVVKIVSTISSSGRIQTSLNN